MLYSNACEYAIRALTRLAQTPETYTLSRRVAAAEGIPSAFLGKIFQDLVRAGFVRSAKGRHGGFKLARPPESITLYEVKAVMDGTNDLDRCVFGLGACSDNEDCPQHEMWTAIRAQIEDYLKGTTLLDLLEACERKRKAQLRKQANAAKEAT